MASAETADTVELEHLLKKRTNTVLDGIINDNYEAELIDKIDMDILLLHDPKRYAGHESAEINFLTQMENAKAALGRFLGFDPAGFSTLRFFQSLDIMIQSTKQKQQS